ncbi:MAG: ubiquitin-like protein Pup [Micrococcales bacterium]|nr:ubiquitin-like protein Pup [Micrococcales bacterium]
MGQIQRRPLPPREPEDEGAGHQLLQAPQVRDQALDALLDDIDTVLEVNAEAFVRGFVQKGGQ